MKAKFAISALVVACMVLVFAPGADASAVVNLDPGETFTDDVVLDDGDHLTYFWSADEALDFRLTDPDNMVIEDTSGIWFSDSFQVSKAGEYTFTWQNTGDSTVRLDYNLNMFGNIEEGLSALAWAAIIVSVVIIVVIVVVVVIVVMSSSKSKAQAQQYPPGYQTAPVAVAGMCPSCGSQLDPQASFCARCGFRYR